MSGECVNKCEKYAINVYMFISVMFSLTLLINASCVRFVEYFKSP